MELKNSSFKMPKHVKKFFDFREDLLKFLKKGNEFHQFCFHDRQNCYRDHNYQQMTGKGEIFCLLCQPREKTLSETNSLSVISIWKVSFRQESKTIGQWSREMFLGIQS